MTTVSKTARRFGQPEPGPVKVATKAGVRYVRQRPDTRVPAMLLALLYPAGEFFHLARVAPWFLAVLALPVGCATWYATRRAYGDCWYVRVVTASLALVPVWLAVAAQSGAFHRQVFLGYVTVALGLWLIYGHTSVLTERRDLRRLNVEWGDFSKKLGMDGAALRGVSQTRLGREYKVHVTGTRRPTARAWVVSDLAEQWASHRSMKSGRVSVRFHPDHAGEILVEERTRDPWADPNLHPTLDPASEWKLPAVRSIHDGPLEIGADPSSGRTLGLPIYERGSCQHSMIVATTGGGKTVTANNLIERATACRDVIVWAVDITKGTLPGIWADAIDWGSGVGDAAKSMQILRAVETVIKERSKLSDGENHHATATAPLILLLVDESGSMQGAMSDGMANAYREAMGFIYRSARSAGVSMCYISQRGVLQHTGTGDARANAAIRVCGRVRAESEMDYIMPDWQATGHPNMAIYGEGHPGVVAIQTPSGPWTAGRTWDLSDFAAVRKIAADRGAPKARLEQGIAAKLGDAYARRRQPALVAAGVPFAELEAAPPEQTIDEEWRIMSEELQGIDRIVEQTAAMQIPVAERVPMTDLIDADKALTEENRGRPVPDGVREAVLSALRLAGRDGVSRAALVTATGIAMPTVAKWLRVMVDQGLIARRGATSNAVYVLPEYAT